MTRGYPTIACTTFGRRPCVYVCIADSESQNPLGGTYSVHDGPATSEPIADELGPPGQPFVLFGPSESLRMLGLSADDASLQFGPVDIDERCNRRDDPTLLGCG